MSTGIRLYFSLTTWLPSHKETGIGAIATHEANVCLKHVLEKQASQQSTKKRKQYTRNTKLSHTDTAEIGPYTAEYENAAGLIAHFQRLDHKLRKLA